MRLEIESKTPKKLIPVPSTVPAVAPTNNDSAKTVGDATVVKALENEIEQLQVKLQREEYCNCKARLGQRQTESHTKKTLSNFQARNVSGRIAGVSSKIEGRAWHNRSVGDAQCLRKIKPEEGREAWVVVADAAEAEEWAIGLFAMSVSEPLWLHIPSKYNLVMHVAEGFEKACFSSSYDYTGPLNLFIFNITWVELW